MQVLYDTEWEAETEETKTKLQAEVFRKGNIHLP